MRMCWRLQLWTPHVGESLAIVIGCQHYMAPRRPHPTSTRDVEATQACLLKAGYLPHHVFARTDASMQDMMEVCSKASLAVSRLGHAHVTLFFYGYAVVSEVRDMFLIGVDSGYEGASAACRWVCIGGYVCVCGWDDLEVYDVVCAAPGVVCDVVAVCCSATAYTCVGLAEMLRGVAWSMGSGTLLALVDSGDTVDASSVPVFLAPTGACRDMRVVLASPCANPLVLSSTSSLCLFPRWCSFVCLRAAVTVFPASALAPLSPSLFAFPSVRHCPLSRSVHCEDGTCPSVHDIRGL
jgi:hypothetical protein